MKTVMLLINGFGVEDKKSYSIYDKELMPNIDMLNKKYIFSSMKADVNNYRDGYRNMCLEVNEMYNYGIFSEAVNNNTLLSNKQYLDMKNELLKRKSKLHLFCFLDDSERIVEQLKLVLKDLNPEKSLKIYLHIILTSGNYEDYSKIVKILSKINVDLADYVKIGLVFGLASISNNNPVTEFNYFFKIFISEICERWQSFSQKFDVCYNLKQSPNMVKPFVVNNGFSLDKDDLFMFWNYDRVDLTTFISMTLGIKYGSDNNNFKMLSLFELISKEKIPYLLNYHPASKSLASNLKDLKATALIVAKKSQIAVINYYANGLQSIQNPDISFIEADNYLFKPKELLSIINTYQQDLIIINYDIDNVKNISELKQLLHNIDIMIGNIYENSLGSKYSILISSLYGINKIMPNDKGEICNVLFSNKVPIIFIDDFITKHNHLVEEGRISNLLPICYKNINANYKGYSIIAKMNALYRLFFK